MGIDWLFIEDLEGFRLDAYVPDPHASKSGVTVAMGVDLGQLTQEELTSLNLPGPLHSLLSPYLGVKGVAALDLLRSAPLELTPEQARTLDAAIQADHCHWFATHYNDAVRLISPPYVRFDELPDAMQTIMLSVSYQYGELWHYTPRFWRACVVQSADGMVEELRKFGDHYKTRRKKEADYLEQRSATS